MILPTTYYIMNLGPQVQFKLYLHLAEYTNDSLLLRYIIAHDLPLSIHVSLSEVSIY